MKRLKVWLINQLVALAIRIDESIARPCRECDCPDLISDRGFCARKGCPHPYYVHDDRPMSALS